MEKNIVKNGTKVILFALDTEDTSVTGVITGHWSTMDGKLMYKCHYKELDGTEGDLDNLMRKDFEVVPNKFINLTPQHLIMVQNTIHQVRQLELLTSSATFAVVFPQCSMVRLRISQSLKKVQSSAMVLAAAKNKGRTDVVAPATGHPDCKRENGFIVSVPGFVR